MSNILSEDPDVEYLRREFGFVTASCLERSNHGVTRRKLHIRTPTRSEKRYLNVVFLHSRAQREPKGQLTLNGSEWIHDVWGYMPRYMPYMYTALNIKDSAPRHQHILKGENECFGGCGSEPDLP